MTALKVALKGPSLLLNPSLNKGSAFTRKEREEFGLMGLLPIQSNSLEEQQDRAYEQYQNHQSNLSKNTFLQSLKAQNWVLFYSLIIRHLKEMFPVIYTPTEAEAIANFSHLFRRPEGIWLSPSDEEHMEQSLINGMDGQEFDLVVVSDGEAILGIGDQGSGAIGISSAKGMIYTLVAGVDPARILPVALDVGTNNEDLLKDDMYLGWRHERMRGETYLKFVDKFVGLIRKHQPNALLHFEDFGVDNAQKLLDTYRDEHPVFNDDVQGTGAVTLATLQAALIVTGGKLSEQRIISFGAGSAGLGIARQLRDAAVLLDGVSEEEANKLIFLVDKHGLLKQGISDKIRDGIDQGFVRQDRDEQDIGDWPEGENDLLEVIKRVKPTVLIGTSTVAGAFNEEIIRAMAEGTERPIILPLSNPTSKCEAHPKDLMKWTNGKALIATGSPYDPVDMPGSSEKYEVAECNNALVYPGLGMGAIVSKADRVTDKMIVAACKALGDMSPARKDPKKPLLPDFEDAQAVNMEIALAVVKAAIDEGVSDLKVPEEDLRSYLEERTWKAEYAEYKYDPEGIAF